ncbi:signal peptidase II [Clostridium sp. Marseille-P299]|uniref:signal peptidase II n=1 Tax=Clostridium sp. Marseille-P299 TaxID=1805477 RepID=UPI000834A7EE|nr:signal peptidase II [Clostridium sp. Marseille-P299]
MKNYKKFIFPISILIMIDQVVKIFIKKYLFDIQVVFIEGIIGFYPKINRKQSWAGNYISIFENPIVVNILIIFCIFIIMTGYQFYRSKCKKESLPARLIFIFAMAGCLCSIIDKIFWGGSLDFLVIPGLFIFDLKDCYLTVAEILFVYMGIKYNKQINVKEYVKFIYSSIRKQQKDAI